MGFSIYFLALHLCPQSILIFLSFLSTLSLSLSPIYFNLSHSLRLTFACYFPLVVDALSSFSSRQFLPDSRTMATTTLQLWQLFSLLGGLQVVPSHHKCHYLPNPGRAVPQTTHPDTYIDTEFLTSCEGSSSVCKSKKRCEQGPGKVFIRSIHHILF